MSEPAKLEFLSKRWLEALGVAASAGDPATGGPASGEAGLAGLRFTLEHRISDAPHGPVAYSVVFAGGRVHVDPSAAAPADLVVRLDFATAAALHRGDLTAQEAIADGRLTLHGAVGRVVEARRALAVLDDRFAELRDATTYDHGP